MEVIATHVVADHGSVVTFEGQLLHDPERRVFFAADHGVAQALAELIEEGGPVACYVEDWQVL